MSQNRTVFVRNDNESITYVGDWTTVQASTVNDLVSLINGPPFSPTLRSTTTTSSFIFPFIGSSISVIGSINIANLSLQNQDPTWKCAVNGVDIDLGPVPSRFNQQNIRILCSQDSGISDGVNELVVNVSSKGMPFYLDLIQYQPSSNVPLDNSLVYISNTDPAVDFISGWGPIGIRNGTTDPEGLVNVTFIGTQAVWYGYTPIGEPRNASSGGYSIDGQTYTSFPLPGLSQSFSSTAYNRPFFTTPIFEMGTHVLSAKYTGSPGQTPFTLEYLVITNGSNTSSSPSNSSPVTGGNHTPHPVPSTNDSSKNSSHVGSIVGGVVGGVGGIVICSIILFFWLRPSRRTGRSRGNGHGVIESFSVQPQFVPRAAPLLAPNETAGNHGTSSTRHLSQHTMSPLSSSNNLISPQYVTDEIISGPRWSQVPIISPSIQSIIPRLRTDTIAPDTVQHEDSGVSLSQPVLAGTVVDVPPTYSEQ